MVESTRDKLIRTSTKSAKNQAIEEVSTAVVVWYFVLQCAPDFACVNLVSKSVV